MTVPIVPGPFAFLASAGGAAGEIAGAVEERRRRLDDEARKRLQDILTLVQGGAEPATFATEGGAALERLGLAPPGQGLAVLQGPAERARLALEGARAEVRTKKAEATGAEFEVEPEVIGQKRRQVAAKTRTEEAGAVTAEVEATAAQSALPIRQRINELITTELKEPESGFGRIAARAAAGTLAHYTSVLQIRYGQNALARERQKELFELFFAPTQAATAVWRDRQDAWDQRRRQELFGREDDKKFAEEWDKNNPKPAYEAVLQELLENAAAQRGLTVEQYNQKLNQAVGLVAEAEEVAVPPAKREALQRRVQEVLAGSKTADQAIEEIRVFYLRRGGADAPLMIQLDTAEFQRMLQEAQGGSKR